ncbi:MAG: PCMD domain-containing protein [Bacteroidales bacterium]|nr:PCMD domain-containing protein [Bacteroidales bacterium]
MKKWFVLICLLGCSCGLSAQEGPQLYNMGFDHWSRKGGAWNPYPEDASAARRVWDTSNRGLGKLGINGTLPECQHVAVPGKGKAAARIESRKVLWCFVAGNLFTGRFERIANLSGAELLFGVPFPYRPRSLSGWCHYIPKAIDQAKEPYLDLLGKTDVGRIELILTDWKSPYHIVTSEEAFIDAATDPHVIGRAQLLLNRDTGGYIRFDIPVQYRSGATPRYAVITATSSHYGDAFTGGNGSILYVDELQFNY